MDTKNDYTPKRRFPGFEGEWEQKKLGDIVEINSGKDYKHLIEGDVPVYGTGGYMLSVSEALSFRDGIGIGRKGTIDKPYILRAPFWTVDTLFYCVPKEKDDLQFVNAIFERINWRSYDESTGVPSLSKVIINNIQVFSSCIDEQRTVGDFLLKVEKQISLHQHKLDKLKNLKKAYLSEMFPAEGERVPKRRFPGFEGEWEMTTLGETVKVTMGQSPDGTTYSDAPGDYILVQGNSDIENGWVKPRIWTTQITKSAEEGDIIMSVRAPAGQVGRTEYNVVIGRGVAAIKGNEFIYQLLVKLDIDAYWKQVSSGSTFDSLNSDNIKNAEIKVPSFEEQEKIGEFFHKLDNSITLQQQKLDDLKKAYLNELFV